MLTLKVVEDDGSEFIKSEIKTVSFNPPKGEKAACLFVWYKDDPAETMFVSGKVFIMNENGKTIADYQLYGYPIVPADRTVKTE